MKRNYPGHRFSNRTDVREELNFAARYEWMPQSILNLPIPAALQFALMLEIKEAIKQANVLEL